MFKTIKYDYRYIYLVEIEIIKILTGCIKIFPLFYTVKYVIQVFDLIGF